jgi:hypothetical protein
LVPSRLVKEQLIFVLNYLNIFFNYTKMELKTDSSDEFYLVSQANTAANTPTKSVRGPVSVIDQARSIHFSPIDALNELKIEEKKPEKAKSIMDTLRERRSSVKQASQASQASQKPVKHPSSTQHPSSVKQASQKPVVPAKKSVRAVDPPVIGASIISSATAFGDGGAPMPVDLTISGSGGGVIESYASFQYLVSPSPVFAPAGPAYILPLGINYPSSPDFSVVGESIQADIDGVLSAASILDRLFCSLLNEDGSFIELKLKVGKLSIRSLTAGR